MVKFERWRQGEGKPQVLSDRLLSQVDVDARCRHHLDAVGAGGVGQGKRLGLPVQGVEPQHGEEVGGWVLLNRTRYELEKDPPE